MPDSQVGENFISRQYRAIIFSVKRKIWRQDDAAMESANAQYQAKRPSVLAKGNHQCVFCGFRSAYTEVHHCNDNHADNREENLAIADPLCHGTQHIGQVGSQQHGVFIHVEGIPQAEFNHLQRTIAVVLEIGSEEEKRQANALLQHLASRAELIKEQWGSAHPSDLANALLNLPEEEWHKRERVFTDMALLYKPIRFATYIRRWVEESYSSLPISTWSHIYERICGI